MAKAKTLELEFHHEEARGKVLLAEGHYGVEFDVTANGERYRGSIDLFHLATDKGPDRRGYLQIVVDPIGDREETHHARIHPDGRIENFQE